MAKCSLKKSPNGAFGGYSQESIEELEGFVTTAFNEALMNAGDGSNGGLIKKAVRDALHKIGDQYSMNQLDKIAEITQKLIDNSEDLVFLNEYIPIEGIKNAINPKYRQTVKESNSSLGEPEEGETLAKKSQFLDDVWGTNVQLKNAYKQEVTNQLINKFIIDREHGVIVKNAGDANRNIRDYKNKLWGDIKEYLIGKGSLDEFTPDIYEDGEYTGVFEDEEVRKAIRIFGSWDAQKIQSDRDTDDYKIFKKWFTLKNFDNFTRMLLGKAIIIKPGTENTFSNEDNYSFATKNDAVITSWRTNEDVVLEQEIGALAQSLINSTPYYQYKNDAETGQYIKFSDFYQIITKLKDSVYNPVTSDITFSRLDSRYRNLSASGLLTQHELDLIQGKTLKDLICSIRENPALYSKLLFTAIINDKDTLVRLNFTDEDLNKMYSLYKGIFAPNGNSIQTIQAKEDYRAQNYYNLITQVVDSINSVKFLQYNIEDGVVKTRLLKDYSAENVRRSIENNIAYINSSHILSSLFKEREAKLYKIQTLADKANNFSGITCTIPDIGITVVVDELGNSISYRDKSGKLLSLKEIEELIDNPKVESLWQFIDDNLAIGVSYDTDLRKAIKMYSGGRTIQDLLKLTSTVLLNKYIANVKGERSHGKAALNNLFDNIYKGYPNKPKYNSELMEIGLYSEAMTPILDNIAKAKALTSGIMQSASVKDADGKTLSQQTLSRLLGNLIPQYNWIKSYDWIGNDKINPFSKMSLMQPGVFRGIYTTREVKSPYGNKPQTQFTVSEFSQSAFLYDFVDGFTTKKDVRGDVVIGNGKVGLLPSVNSDKNAINRMCVDLRQKVISKHPELNGRQFIDLNSEELQKLTSEQLGHYFKAVNQNIQEDFNKLFNWINGKYHLAIHSLEDINSRYSNPADQLYQWVKEYNDTHNDVIQLIDQTHYSVDKKTKRLKSNMLLKGLETRFSDPSKLAKFMQWKETEVLKSLLDENVEIRLIDGTNSSAKTYLKDNYKDWVHNGKMVFAKVNGKDILTKQDLINLGLDINDPHSWNIELHPMLSKYNALDYFFTSQYMYAGVGCHTNHPSKVDYNVPIIYKHPKLGLSTFLQNNPQANNYLMDFDDFFNEKRDAFIEVQTGVEKSIPFSDDEGYIYYDTNPEWIKTKENYLIQNQNNPEFQDFVKKAWNEAKLIAKEQNKILLNSSSIVLKMFPQDFSKVLTMSQEEAVARGMDPDWKNAIDTTLNGLIVPKIEFKSGEYFDKAFSSYLTKEMDKLLQNETEDEASRFAAQHKRNVSYTATMHEFQLNQIDGVPTVYNMAIMSDLKSDVYTVQADVDKATNFDGATFVNPFIVIWENNSLNGDKAGINKKQFVHFYDRATGTGGIIKTAGFGLTNDKIRQFDFYRNMMYNMTSKNWKNADGSQHIMRDGGILKDFEGNDIDYGDFYYRKGAKFYKRRIQSYDGNNTYSILEQEVDENGEAKGNEDTIQVQVNSNYDVWQMFGGMNSVDFLDGTLQGSEKSIEMTAHAANIYGTKKEGVIRAQTADDIIQPMKHSDIHYMPTIGAVKHGAANINPVSSFFNRNGLSFMQVEVRQAGIQLDKEHQADNEDLSLMTQVISAACSMGYTKGEATNLYNALYSLSKQATKAFRDEMGDLLNGFSDSFNAAVTETIMKSLINASATDGDMLQLVAKNIIKKINAERQFSINKTNYVDIDKEIPYSDAAVSAKVVSSLTAALTKAGIKTKMPGLLAVLNPAEGIIKMYKVPAKDKDGNILLNEDGSTVYKYVTMDAIEKEYDTENAFEIMEQLQAETGPLSYNTDETGLITSMPDVKIGRKYLVTFSDGVNKSTKVVNVTLPHRVESDTSTVFYNNVPYQEQTMGYRKLIDYLNGIVNEETGVTNQITEVKEFLIGGQDLDSYDVKFQDSLGNRWQMSDLDIVQDYFEARESKDPRRKVLEILSKYDKDQELKAAIIKEFNESNNSNKVKIVNDLNDNFNGIFLTETPMYKEFFQKYALKFLNREMQRQLTALNPENTEPLNVLINNKVVTVQPSTIDITSYGTVIPKTAASSFGLNQYDQVSDIVNNPDFFLDRLAKRLNTKVQDYYKDGQLVYNYHLELKRNDGNHVYIRRGIDNFDFANEIQWFKYVDSDGHVFRVNSDGDIMHPMYSENDKIYTDYDGNEIIVTEAKDTWKDSNGNEVKNPNIKKIRGITIDQNTGEEIHLDSPFTFYLDNLNYNFINLNANCSEAELLNLLDAARRSKSKKANNFAKRLAKIGNYDKQVDYLDKLTKYEDLIKGDTKNPAYLALQKKSRQIWTSFMKYLENVAARIPAQSQQSFMAQRVAMFENTDTNNAYVSKFQFFLQGSDLDIDAVSIQTFDINSNGIYETYSPYANLDSPALLKVSEKYLPFPTGDRIKVEEIHDPTITTMHQLIAKQHYDGKRLFGLANKLNQQDALFLINYTRNKDVIVEVNTNSEQNIKDLADILESINSEDWYSYEDDISNTRALTTLLFPDNEMVLDVDLYDKIENGIIEAIDKHNTYLKNNSKAKNDRILKNFAVTSLLNIIKNPVNLREAQSSVDVMTSTAKNLTKASPKNAVQKTFTPGNVFNKIQSINENMVGKDGIAICATGLKSFFALTHMYNTVLNDENTSNEEKEALMCKVTIGGKTYRGLANVNANQELMESLADAENGNFITLQNYLLAQEWESDAANEASAFLSLSTDNAKELALAKLNAGTQTLGMYLYGLSLGVPVDTLFKIMTSPLAFRLVELAKGDIFSGNSGCRTILGALDYLHKDPLEQLSRFNTFDLSIYNEGKPKDQKILGPADFAWQLLQNSLVDDYNEKLPLLRQLAYKNNAIQLIEDLRSKVNQISSVIQTKDEFNLYSTLYNQALDFMEQYIADVKLELNSGNYDTVYGKSVIATDLETLALGADEYKEIGKILRLNKEVNTNALDLQNQVANIEEVITRRLRQLSKVKNRGGLDTHGATKDELKNPDKYKIDLEKFLYDEIYQQEKIMQYDRIKQSYNVLRVLTTDPQYKGYMETLYMAHQGLLNKQLKYRFTVGKIADFIQKNKVTGNLQQQVLKNGNNYVDYKLRQNWMRDSKIQITIPGSTDKMKTYAFIGTPNSYSQLYFDKTIQLGTDMGDANFKLWMEQTLIPRLKADPTLKDNIFIQHLSPIVNSRTNLGMTAVYYGLNGINMLPQSDAEREMFDIHKDAFNKLATYDLIRDAKGHTFAIKDLFYLYSLICNNGKFGPTSLHKIFEDYLDSGLAQSYKHFIAEKDRDLDFYQDLVKTCTDEWLAPMSSPYVGGSKVLKYKDQNNEQILLYKKKEKKSKGGYDYDVEQDMDDIFMNDMGFDPEGGKDPMAEINNYVKQESSALAKRDYSFFSNPEVKYNTSGFQVLSTKSELINQHPITYEVRDGKPVLVNIGGDEEIAKKFMKLMKDRKGILPTKQILGTDGFTAVINEEQIESELNSIINCG